MKRSHKILLSVLITLLILFGAGALGYEVLAMNMNSSATQAMSQPNNLKAIFIHQLFADITPSSKSTPASASVANTRLHSSTNTSLSITRQSDNTDSILHFASKQEALKFAMKKFSPTELVSLLNDFAHPDQVTHQEVENLRQKIESRFSQDELLALKESLDTN